MSFDKCIHLSYQFPQIQNISMTLERSLVAPSSQSLPAPWATTVQISITYKLVLFCFFHKRHVNGSTSHVLFCVWFLLLQIAFWDSFLLHVSVVLFLLCQLVWLYHILFIHASVNWHLSCLQFVNDYKQNSCKLPLLGIYTFIWGRRWRRVNSWKWDCRSGSDWFFQSKSELPPGLNFKKMNKAAVCGEKQKVRKIQKRWCPLGLGVPTHRTWKMSVWGRTVETEVLTMYWIVTLRGIRRFQEGWVIEK